MKTFQTIKTEQYSTCKILYEKAIRLVPRVKNQSNLLALFLTGSVARGDARIGPYGLFVDLLLIVKEHKMLNLTKIFGPDIDKEIPFHCVSIHDVNYQIQVKTEEDFFEIPKPEEVSFALAESKILYAINGSFIPRMDWIIYLLHDQNIIPHRLEQIEKVFLGGVWNRDDIEHVKELVEEMKDWMKKQIHRLGRSIMDS